jgi:hypothetical protein
MAYFYVCGCCGEWLIPVQGDQREWHYRHKVDTNCNGAPMTMVHRMAQQILLENNRVVAPGKIGFLNYTTAIGEVPVGSYGADVGIDVGGKRSTSKFS